MTGRTAETPRPSGTAPFTSRLRDEACRYQRVLERNPRDPQALVGVSLIALASGQSAPAVLMAQAAVAVAPDLGPAWVALGQALRAEGRQWDAEKAYTAAVRIDGTDPLARLGLGEVKLATDRPEDAIAEFEIALRRDPALVSAQLGMGHALVFGERYAEALESYGHALLLNPKLSEAEFATGYTLARMGRAADAERRYRRAIALRPDFAAAWMNLGCLLREQGQEFYARAALERALELRPGLIAAWINLAVLERECDRNEDAESHLRRAFALNPEQAETQVAWAQLCAARGDAAGARGWLRWAMARDENNEEAVNLGGILLHNEGRFAEAVAAFKRAEALGSAPAASNRGNSLLELGRAQEALAAHRTAVVRDPHNAGARYNVALTELRLGVWSEGWRNYEARWRSREVHRSPRSFDQPRWRGEALHGERILIHAEQGLGDTIQFCRYAAMVAARGGVPILQVQAPVERLMHSLAVVRAGHAQVAQLGQTPPAFDLECPLMSLPAVFATTTETVPWPGAYLAADPEIVAKRIPRSDDGLRVGLGWAGNPNYKADRERSVHLDTFLPLLRAQAGRWISLQKGPATAHIGELPPDVRVIDACSGDADLAETAAVIATLDLVITTDTCVAHLAGAMGKPVWILLPHLFDWRWMQDIETTPWYPSARLFRQPSRGDWQPVIQAVISSLREFRVASRILRPSGRYPATSKSVSRFHLKRRSQTMTPTWFVVPAAALVLGVAAFNPTPSAAAAPEPAFSGQQYGWDVPPQEFNEVQRRGFHDGVQGAQKDYGNGRRPNVNERNEYRDPNDLPHDIPPELRDAYRAAFRRGYGAAASHLWGAQAPAYNPPQQQNWEWGMRGLQSDAERRGYNTGVAEARNDFETHNHADPDDHGVYVSPPVPPELFDDYRRGYMRGYNVAMSQLSGEPSWEQYRGDPATWQPPSAYTEWKRRGFREGIEGARKDYANGRRPNPNNRDEYRNPSAPDQFRGEYREGFRRGYEIAANRLYGGM